MFKSKLHSPGVIDQTLLQFLTYTYGMKTTTFLRIFLGTLNQGSQVPTALDHQKKILKQNGVIDQKLARLTYGNDNNNSSTHFLAKPDWSEESGT